VLTICTLSIRNFRNLPGVDVTFGPRLNVVSGDNGQGKTNLLESVYALATSQSFRTAKPADMIALGQELASVRAEIRDDDQIREQSLGIRRGGREVRIDGKRPVTFAKYALSTPVVVFHPGALALAAGASAERRKMLDRVALHLEPSSLEDHRAYTRALRCRQRVLEVRGETAGDLDGWEDLMATHGAALMAARGRAAEALSPAARGAFTRIGALAAGELVTEYAPSSPTEPQAFRAELARLRSRDRARRSATSGPHRDELRLTLGDRAVRGIASQGQQRAVTLALELAEIDVIERARSIRPILLLDDVSSELDGARTRALFAALRDDDRQVILTTTRPELIELEGLSSGQDRRDFRVVQGRILPL